jgi:hypothetical protein
VRFFWLEHNGTRYTLREGETLLGRGPECTLFVDDTSVSRQHALFRRVGSNVTVSDLGSSNGTYVNDKLVDGTQVVELGDVVTVGDCSFALGADAIEPSAVPPAIEIIERNVERPMAQVTTAPHLGAIAVLESLVGGRSVAEDPAELAAMIKASVDRLIATSKSRGQTIGPEEAARVVSVVRSVASWFPDRSFDAWLDEVTKQLGVPA